MSRREKLEQAFRVAIIVAQDEGRDADCIRLCERYFRLVARAGRRPLLALKTNRSPVWGRGGSGLVLQLRQLERGLRRLLGVNQ